MADLTGGARDALRAKLNVDLKRILHRVVFAADGGIAMQLFTPGQQRIITVCEPDADSVFLTTAQDVMAAERRGEMVGIAA